MVEQYKLNNYVTFHGKKSGKNWMKFLITWISLLEASVATGFQFKHIKSLKNREYCARGIPFFYSQIDPDFEDTNFIYKVPSNDQPIDINAIIEFLANQKFDRLKLEIML